MLDLLVPPDLIHGARRVSTILVTLGVLVLFLFPASATAGTEVPLDRWVTGGLLVAAGVALRLAPKGVYVTLAAHAVAQLALGASWAMIASVGLLAYVGLSSLRVRAGGGGGAAADDGLATLCFADVVRENVESIAMALLIALTVREFLYEAFLIPTASMQPTILGEDRNVGRTHGDRLLATKVPLLWSDPPRWSIVVFKYPLYRRVNFIKRLVGLPGEHMELRDGDVYIDGEVVSKPERVQNELWFDEYPLEGQPTPLSRALTNADENAEWTVGDDAAQADVPAGVESRLYYDETLSSEESDLRIDADVGITRVEGDSAVLLRVEGAGRRVDLAVGAEGAVLDAPGVDGMHLDVALPGGTHRIGLGVADRVVRVWLDGRLVARVQSADQGNGGNAMPRAYLGLRGTAARFSDVSVKRDLQYTKRRVWDIPEDGFIMLGDNTLSSKDSREWDVNVVTAADGRVYEGEAFVKLEDESQVAFRKVDDAYVFIDVDGVLRHVPAAGATVEYQQPRPYVRREDLIGRAFVIFFPFPPFGDLRIQMLP